jgi:hypothetical protein
MMVLRRFSAGNAEENVMAKGQVRGNKEAKKPKKDKQVVVPNAAFISTQKAAPPQKHKS